MSTASQPPSPDQPTPRPNFNGSGDNQKFDFYVCVTVFALVCLPEPPPLTPHSPRPGPSSLQFPWSVCDVRRNIKNPTQICSTILPTMSSLVCVALRYDAVAILFFTVFLIFIQYCSFFFFVFLKFFVKFSCLLFFGLSLRTFASIIFGHRSEFCVCVSFMCVCVCAYVCVCLCG